jgi:GntR family transcriptional regulator, transcriptional repressor for pyruvate dehydrogenase complex
MRIADDLRASIARGELRPGDSLPIESDLMVELAVSRFTLREALRLLEADGLIVIRRGVGGGPRVVVPSIAPVARAFGVQLQLRDVPLADVLALRNDLVLDAVQESTPTAEGIARLRHVLQQMAAAEDAEDVVPFYRAWIQLTNEMAWLSPNRARSMTVDALQYITELHLGESYRRTAANPSLRSDYFGRVVRSYSLIVDLLAEGRKEEAVQALARQLKALILSIRLLFAGQTGIDVFPQIPLNGAEPDPGVIPG